MLRQLLLIACIVAAKATITQAETNTPKNWHIEQMVSGLETPWAIDVLPDGSFLVTERDGTLYRVANGVAGQIKGTPRVRATGQGGLLDVMTPRDFERSRAVYLTYAKSQSGGVGTALAVGRLSVDGTRLTDVRTIFEARNGGKGGRHFGSRVIEARDGTLLMTIGDRGSADMAQNLDAYNGKIIRINRDGSIPPDNPFLGTNNAHPEIWSYGHRNPQGLGMDAQGRVWTSEHGARGGDEINLIQKGANYGWPVISYGRHYSGAKIGEGSSRPGMEQPQHYWDPSIAPSGLVVYSGRRWPEWRGDIFVGSLKFDYISRLGGSPLREIEQIKSPETERVRDVIEAPDGTIWFISVGQGAVYRLSPTN